MSKKKKYIKRNEGNLTRSGENKRELFTLGDLKSCYLQAVLDFSESRPDSIVIEQQFEKWYRRVFIDNDKPLTVERYNNVKNRTGGKK